MIIHTLESLEEMFEIISKIKTKLNYVNWWFRGQANKEWILLPSIFRDYTKEQESSMAYDFYIKSRPILATVPEKDSLANWLTLMQHYGLPTRLLDWTNSPLVACYFAVCCEKLIDHETDACIWMLAPSGLNESFGYEKYLYPIDDEKVLSLIEPAFKHTQLFGEKIIACWAVEKDLRVYVQQSAFTLHDCDRSLCDLEGAEKWLAKLIIPKLLKEEFEKTLKTLGIDRTRLFPDMEHISNEIKRNAYLK